MKRIVVFGRTGAGKSSLGNKIFGADNFLEGHTLFSETSESKEKVFKWPLDPSLKVSFIDSPGFADNRPDTSNQQIINNIFKLLKDLREGFNIGIFCIAAKTRIDSDDMDEIRLLQTILGAGVFQHLWIAITRINTFEEQTKNEYYATIPRELPQLLNRAGIPLSSDRILFADFSDFEEKFLKPVSELLYQYPSYKPENSLRLEEEEQRGAQQFLHSREMQAILEKYNEMFDESKEQIGKAIEHINKLGPANKPALQKQLQRKQEELRQLEEKIRDFKQAVTAPAQEKGPINKEEGKENGESNIRDQWLWKVDGSFQQLREESRIEHIGESKFNSFIIQDSLESGTFKWVVRIDKKSSDFWSSLKYCFTPGCPTFGIQTEQGKIYSLANTGAATINMRNTDSFASARVKNDTDFVCELDTNRRRFTVSVDDLVIAINKNDLETNTKFFPFVSLWKGNVALIEPRD